MIKWNKINTKYKIKWNGMIKWVLHNVQTWLKSLPNQNMILKNKLKMFVG